MPFTATELQQRLRHLDGASYGAYRDLASVYEYPQFTLRIDRIQGDPFAAPSHIRVQVPQAIAQFSPSLWATSSRQIALNDYLTRQLTQVIRQLPRRSGSGNSGSWGVNAPGQAVLARTSVHVTAEQVEARLTIGLPGFGRRIAGQQAAAMLGEDLPKLVAQALRAESLDQTALDHHCDTVEAATALRHQLADRGLVAFIADGACLPRQSGISDRPLIDPTVQPFQSPPSLRVELDRPHFGKITGLGIPAGITLIVGGGYHGKSTLLRAIAHGVYNHIPGDGREWVVTEPNALKIRAEDGRSVTAVNISPFISQLPHGQSTQAFSTENASGSTSQAAAIIEAIAAGASTLLIDEDTAATNLMIRDRRMQALIAKSQEPITPLVDKIRALYTDHQVSTVIVMGGSGDYLDVADTVVAMTQFQPQDVTTQARQIAQQFPSDRQPEGGTHFGTLTPRRIDPTSFDPRRGKQAVKWSVRDRQRLSYGQEEVDCAALEQLVEPGQLRAIATILAHWYQQGWPGDPTLADLTAQIQQQIQQRGWDTFTSWPRGDLVAPRSLELMAVVNRWRSLRVR